MKTEHERAMFVCRRLRQMGFVSGKTLKLYGDIFDLESNPAPQGSQYVVEAISHRSGILRRILLPMPITALIEHEFDVMAEIAVAA